MRSTMMLNVPGTLWQDLGTTYDKPVTNSVELIEGAHCTYHVSAHEMRTDIHDSVLHYHAVCRDDTNEILGVVNTVPNIVQNEDTFRVIEPLLESGELTVDTVAPFANGKSVYGIFKINHPYIIEGDQIQHYIIVVNDHTKPNGKVTVLNTPVRIACLNALSHALSKSIYSISVPILDTYEANKEIARKIMSGCASAIDNLDRNAKRLLSIPVSPKLTDEILDELFPVVSIPETAEIPDYELAAMKQNESQEMLRDQFMECVHVDNLANFNGTAYQIYNAYVDFNQHYYKSGKSAFDLDKRIQKLPGIGTQDTDASKTTKLLKMLAKAA